ncbi:MAG: asparagine synthase (glutamine-hydrolyzing) [Flavobacteriales bacterium]|jgi:asparagine synthase (glutamine-hydrolysing)|nr:asparagine synthase (glutamine-hydrolyzing) [Flavobacteriales bacterium]
MCGICGFNFSDRALLRSMNDCISHRGPNSKGYFTDKYISLGHRRLSIIDLTKSGNQPMFNEDKSIVLIYNGELYNFKEIKKSLQEKGHSFSSNTDTEVVVHAYEEYGTNCLNHFNGFFSFALYDSKKKILFLARDRIGIKPLYYYYDQKKFIFASEIKCILEDETVKRDINKNSLNEYFMFRYVHSNETILKNIYRVKPGCMLLFNCKNNKLDIKKYWDVSIENKNYDENICAKNIFELFRDSVERRLMSDVPLGVYLSGGIDSSSVVAMMKRFGVKNINTYSVGFQYDVLGNELEYAKKVSDIFETKHHEFIIKPDIIKELPKIVWHLDEPLADPAVVPIYFLSKEAAKSVTVILSGDGADELFAGYDQYKFTALGNKIRFLPRMIRKNLIPLTVKALPKQLLDKIYKYSSTTGSKIHERFGKFISSVNENKAKAYLEVISVFDEDEKNKLLNDSYKSKNPYLLLNKTYFSNHKDFLNQLTYMDLKTYLPEDLLMKPDKMCMAFGIEARVPFLDHRLVEYAFNMPSRLKLKGNTTKYIMKKSFKNLLPYDILHRKKQPFQVPLDQWMSKDLKDYFRNLIEDKINDKFFNKNYIKKILDNYNRSKLFYGRQIWSLGIFNIWHKIYVEEENISNIF